jgi:hypothetical protein
MSTHKSPENMEHNFSNLSAEDLENLDVEELEQRLELAAFDYTASVFTAGKGGVPDPGQICPPKSHWFC